MNKKCPSCGSSKTKKKGFKSGVQRYLCRACKRSFVSTRRPSRLRLSLWKSFIWKRDTVKLLAARHSRSVHWIRKELRAYELPKPIIVPDKIVAIMDCVFFRRSSGYLVVRDAHNSSNVYWSEIESETIDEYQCARDTLEGQGFSLNAVIIDGRPGVRKLSPICRCRCVTFIRKLLLRATSHGDQNLKLARTAKDCAHSVQYE